MRVVLLLCHGIAIGSTTHNTTSSEHFRETRIDTLERSNTLETSVIAMERLQSTELETDAREDARPLDVMNDDSEFFPLGFTQSRRLDELTDGEEIRQAKDDETHLRRTSSRSFFPKGAASIDQSTETPMSMDSDDDLVTSMDGSGSRHDRRFVFEGRSTCPSSPNTNMKRVSSCYFSVQSNATDSTSFADLFSLWEQHCEESESTDSIVREKQDGMIHQSSLDRSTHKDGDMVYQHDILMNVFSYLDTESLANFSETARQPNFEVFYYLQLQLQQTLIDIDTNTNKDRNEAHYRAEMGCLSRLAQMDQGEAQATVQEFLDSNLTLAQRTHDKQRRHRYFPNLPNMNPAGLCRSPWSPRFSLAHQKELAQNNPAAFALFVVMMAGGAAALSTTANVPLPIQDMIPIEELCSNPVFQVGFVGSALMGAAQRRISNHEQQHGESKDEENEDEPIDPHGVTTTKSFSVASMMLAAYRRAEAACYRSHPQLDTDEHEHPAEPLTFPQHSLTPNPYDHYTTHSDGDMQVCPTSKDTRVGIETVVPSGCVGAYRRAIHRARTHIRHSILLERKARMEALPTERRTQLASAFIDACCSDNNLDTIRELSQTVDVEAFYVGSDGTETCALHAAAFHGSSKILEYLCQGVYDSDSALDGGLCNVNLQDANGWTALHFAAGANSASAVKILASHGADHTVEAANGYTPLQWALRLQNKDVASELRQLGSEHPASSFWMSRQPLSAIASRLIAMIPSH